jgi:3-oxoacyl-[acyl-carrier protein] reductase
LSREGARVAICARGAERLAATAAELPGEVLAIPADVTEAAAPAELVAAATERFGALDILVANAGGPPPARAFEATDEGLLDAVNANLLTSIRLVRAAVPHMRDAGWGRICLITSYSVKQPIPTLAYSNTARTGLWAWAKTAAQDLVEDGITLNLACPGPHGTDRMKELGTRGRMGDPEDFGRVVAFLCSEPAGFVSGAALQVDGAGTLGLL